MKRKLSELASIAEIIASVGVILTLIFVGLELSEGNRETRAATTQLVIKAEMDMVTVFIANANTWDKVVTGAPIAEGEEMRRAINLYNLSMLETALEESKGSVSTEELNKIIEMGRGLINEPIVLLEGVKETLEKLTTAGYKLIVTTKGDLLDQQRKLSNSGLEKYFDHIEIMSYKSKKDYLDLLKHLGVRPDEFIMIGNSMKSDILPILNIGGYGIHVPHHTTWAHELVDDIGKQDKLWVVEHISEVAEILEVNNEI